MGHGSMRAALIYQHATNARDRSIADAMRALVESSWIEAPQSSDNGANHADEDGDDRPAESMVPGD
jgi:hypothetical protein